MRPKPPTSVWDQAVKSQGWWVPCGHKIMGLSRLSLHKMATAPHKANFFDLFAGRIRRGTPRREAPRRGWHHWCAPQGESVPIPVPSGVPRRKIQSSHFQIWYALEIKHGNHGASPISFDDFLNIYMLWSRISQPCLMTLEGIHLQIWNVPLPRLITGWLLHRYASQNGSPAAVRMLLQAILRCVWGLRHSLFLPRRPQKSHWTYTPCWLARIILYIHKWLIYGWL